MTQVPGSGVREVIEKDEIGRIICTQYKNFWFYVDKKKLTKADLLKMKSERREEFFMKWKHGMNDPNTNWEFEYALRAFLKSFQNDQDSIIDPYFKDSVIVRRKFEEYCDSIKREINLWAGNQIVPDEVKQLVDQVGGMMVSYERREVP